MYREVQEANLTLNGLCPVCGSHAFENSDRPFTTLIICPTCGKFRYGSMAELFLRGLQSNGMQLSYKVSYHLRTISERAYGKRDNSFYPIYTHAEFESMTASPDP